jgi:hypothetical protein
MGPLPEIDGFRRGCYELVFVFVSWEGSKGREAEGIELGGRLDGE